MTHRQRTALVLSASVVAMFALAAFADLSIELGLVSPVVELGEPFDVTIRLMNTGETSVVTRDDALSVFMLWPYLQLVRILPDGIEIPIVSDRPVSSPSPSSRWIERDGVHVAVCPAGTVEPGATAETRMSNVLRYLPIVDPGDYRLSLPLELPTYSETFTDPAFGETLLIEVYNNDGLDTANGSTEFSLVLSPGLTEEDVEWFRRGRGAFLNVSPVEDAVSAFAPPGGEASEYVLACSEYWIGEAYQRFWENDRAIESYESVLSDYTDTLFASYAEARLGEIRGSGETP